MLVDDGFPRTGVVLLCCFDDLVPGTPISIQIAKELFLRLPSAWDYCLEGTDGWSSV